MISRRIVLILGAGASVPYGFPTGAELFRRLMGVKGTVRCFNDMGFDSEQQKEFIRALGRSGRRSVDAFLEFRQDFVDIGKAFMAYFLIRCEHETRLFDSEPDWYHYLFDTMSCSLESFSTNSLSIITFNYDRSFEHFLFTALCNCYNASEDQAASAVQSIPIVHVHGQLGLLPWQCGASPKNARSYQPTADTETVRVATDGIKIIPEAEDSTPELKDAHKYLQDAEQVHFLGFGYLHKNMERLRLPKRGEAHPWLKAPLGGTFYGLEKVEATALVSRYVPFSHCSTDETTLAYLRNDERFLSACRPE